MFAKFPFLSAMLAIGSGGQEPFLSAVLAIGSGGQEPETKQEANVGMSQAEARYGM